MTRKEMIELQKILNEHEVYSDIIEYLLATYYEKREVFYDREEGVWYSRLHGREISLEELDNLSLDLASFISSSVRKIDYGTLNNSAKQHIFDKVE